MNGIHFLFEESLARTKEAAQTVMPDLGGTRLNFWNSAR
jgi:hypothetical protein